MDEGKVRKYDSFLPEKESVWLEGEKEVGQNQFKFELNYKMSSVQYSEHAPDCHVTDYSSFLLQSDQ